jgi:hypothetical protein
MHKICQGLILAKLLDINNINANANECPGYDLHYWVFRGVHE